MYTLEQCARQLGTTRNAVYRIVRQQSIETVMVGHTITVSLEAVRHAMTKRAKQAVA